MDPSQDACDGFGPIVSLRAEDLIQPPDPSSPLGMAVTARLTDVAERLRWLDETDPVNPAGLGAELTENLLNQALSADDQFLDAQLDDAEGPPEGNSGSSRFKAALALKAGGLTIAAPGRFSTSVARLSDDVALHFNATVEPVLAAGTISVSRSRLSDSHQLLVIALRKGVQILDGSPSDITVPEGEWALIEVPSVLEVEVGGLALIIGITMPTRADFWSALLRKAGYWPRVRADLPYDIEIPATVYGESAAVDLKRLLLEQFADLQSTETLGESLASVWARCRPSPRPFPDLELLPDSPARWVHRTVRGCFPGGVGTISTKQPETTCWTAAGCAVFTADHLIPFIAALVEGNAVNVAGFQHSCPTGDSDCIGHALDALYPLGFIEILG